MSKPEVERQKSPNLGFWGRIGLESLWIFCKFFSILPYWFRYYVVEPPFSVRCACCVTVIGS